ncbi:MAG TPA: hypothetical protein VKH19_02805 [Gemmatimonadaceae bacterium]|nr:hypothetical protein [Gemmatimonadaceae bacterium]
MRIYVAVTGGLFLLLAGIHVAHVFAEPNMAREPFFIVVTLLALGMAGWAVALFRRRPQA